MRLRHTTRKRHEMKQFANTTHDTNTVRQVAAELQFLYGDISVEVWKW